MVIQNRKTRDLGIKKPSGNRTGHEAGVKNTERELDSSLVIVHIVRMDTILKGTETPDRTELGFRAALLIREVNARLNAAIAAELAETGLTLPQITLIKALAHGRESTITELARELSTGKSTVVGIVDRLERAGLVERRRGGGDRREVHIAFSPGARDRVTAIRATVDATFSKAFGSIPAGEIEAFGLSLEKILLGMGAACAEAETQPPAGNARDRTEGA
jgi:DNA-binding MarR family transcriptional regulator